MCAEGCTHRVVQTADRGLHLRRRDARVPGAPLGPRRARRRDERKREVTVAFVSRHGRGVSSSAIDAAGKDAARGATTDTLAIADIPPPNVPPSGAGRCADNNNDGNTRVGWVPMLRVENDGVWTTTDESLIICDICHVTKYPFASKKTPLFQNGAGG